MQRWRSRNDIVQYTGLFLIIVIGGYAILLKNHLSMVWYIDAVSQYYPAILYTGQYLRECVTGLLSGQSGIHFYDLSIAWGENIISALNYYGFGDPINLLTVLITNNESGSIFYALSYFVRIWLAGLCFQEYCATMGMDSRVSMIASLMYCFGGFTMKGGGRYIEWLSVLMYFPLMLVGTERTIRSKRMSHTLIFAIAYGSVSGFYFLYMASLAMGIYWIIRLVMTHGRQAITRYLQTILCLVSAYVLGIMLTAPIFLTEIMGYLRSIRSDSNILEVLLDVTNYLPTINEEIVQWSPFTELSYASYILGIEIIAVFLLFCYRNRRSRQLQIAVVIALIASMMPITGWIFNGFGETNIRWIFIVHFLMALVFAHVFSQIRTVEIISTDGATHFRWSQHGIRRAVAAIVIVNIVVNIYALYSDHGIGWKNEYIAMDDLDRYTSSPITNSRTIAGDGDLYRIAHSSLTNINGRPENVAMLNGYHGLCWWLSIVNGCSSTLSNTLNESDSIYRSWGVSNNPVYEAFCGAKYYLCRESESASEPEYVVETLDFNEETWCVYENPYYFGMAYSRDHDQSRQIWDGRQSMEYYYVALYSLFIDGKTPVTTTYIRNADTFRIELNQTADDELIVLVPYDPNWHAYVDGVEAEVSVADIGFMAIPIDEESQEVILHYVPYELYVGCICMGLAVLVLAIRAIVIAREHRVSG